MNFLKQTTMRKLLLLLVCALVSIGTWAESIGSNGSTYTYETTTRNSLKKLTINLTTAGDLASAINNELNSVKGQANCVVITGPVNAADLQKLSDFSGAELLDISGVEYSGTLSGNISVKQGGQGVVIPSSWSLSEYFSVDPYKHSVVFQKDGTELNTYVADSSPLVNIMSHDKYDYDVFDGMTTMSIYEYKPYQGGLQSTTTVDANIVNAMNSTNYDIKTINLENGKADNLSISIQNGHIETLNLSGLQMTNGTTLNIGGEMKDQMALKNLNLTNVKVDQVDATNLETLETINLKNANLTNIDITQTDNDYSGIVISVDDPALKDKITPAPSSIWGEDVAEHIITDRSLTDNDGCSITPNEDGTVATVHAVTPGHFKALFLQYKDKFGDGVTFKFDSECNLNADDLAILAGEKDQYNNNTNRNKYYVDLYDVPVATTNIEAVITEAIGQMRTNNWQYKGLLLPKNPTTVGTTLIQDSAEDQTKLATCSQFIAYNNGATTVAHVYNTDNTATATYNTNVEKLESVLELHPEIGTNTTNYLVTTNSTSKVSMTALPETATRVETINNDMVNPDPNSPAKMYVYPSESGKFDNLVQNTGVAGTANLDLLELNDAANPDDFTAINNFTDGPRVLDLRNLTSPITKAMLESLTNSHIEFILLPESMANKEEVCEVNYSASMTSLKAVIASTSTTLVAHVATPGSLAEARSLVTGGSVNNGVLYPTSTGLTSVTLSGELNAADINNDGAVGADGHWGTSGSSNPGLNSEYPTSLDLELAVFPVQEDMNFSKASKTRDKLTSIILPTSPEMDLIPENCLNNYQKLTEICIPYNYQILRSGAFDGTQIDHITTTDASGALIDNGEHTWTLSANITELGSVPSEPGVFVPQVFQHDLLVTDIYILATKTPKCYAGVFPANASYGYGGASGSDTYCRDRYFNSDDRLSKAWIVLRFPSEESYNAAKAAGQATDATYAEMKANYTDPTRVYSKKEQTGAVDANGDAIVWPTRQEANRSYNQGSRGLTWLAWDPTSGTSSTGEDGAIAGGATHSGANTGSIASMDGMPTTTSGYTFNADYMGWHQIALAQATYYEPAERVVNEKIIREYEEAGWYTFCIPFNMSYKQVVEMLGVPKSTENVINKLNGEEVTDNIMPDIRQLSSVTRKAAANGKPNIVMLRMTNNLWQAVTPGYTAYLQITHNTNSETHQLVNADPYNSSNTIDDRLSLIGGRPYIIKAYKRKQVVDGVDQFKIKGQNLGKYVLGRYADQFGIESSIVQNTKYESYECFEQLGSGDLQSLRFAKPYEEHKVQAVRDDEKTVYLTYDNNGNTYKYYYTMIGQFWQQPLPQYCLYMSKGSWYRYTDTSKGYTWDPYKCVIMATQELVKEEGDKHYGGGFRRGADDEYTNYPQVEEGTTDLIKTEFKLGFLDGRDDDDFGETGTSAKYVFSFDDEGIIELGEDGNEVTAISNLDGEDILPVNANGKVYNLSGQHVGNSLNGLSKGMYIVNGKKVVVK